MPLEYLPFQAEHLRYLTPQVTQRLDHAVLLNSGFASIVNDNFGLSAWRGAVCVGAAGCVPIFAHRAVAWAVFSHDAAPHMLEITRKVRRVMAALPYRRIEISVRESFWQGQKFAELIGMQLETPEPMRAHGATGDGEYQYAVVR